MKIPISGRKRALLIVDVQKSFIIDRNKYIIPNIKSIIKNIDYDLIISSITYNEKNTQWDKQIGWTEMYNLREEVIPEISKLINKKNHIKVDKLTRSVFKADKNINKILKNNNIEEIHIVGYETNDCIMATVFESIDLGYYTFTIEEACETRTKASNHSKAINILNYLNLTNNSNFVGSKNIKFINLKKILN